MTSDDISLIVEELKKLQGPERTPYMLLLVTRMIRDVAYYLILAAVVWALGRRLVMALLAAWKESRHASP
jgi:hypothetical protein